MAAGAALRVGVDGGAGADEASIMIEDTAVAAGASLSIDVDGGAGDDDELIHNGDNTWAGNVAFTFNGGAGADEIGFTDIGSMVATGASMSIAVDSGSGNDDVRGGFGFDPESRGVIAIIFQGSSGDDDLTLDDSASGDPGLLTAHVDGGPGFDVAHVSQNVDNVDCESVIFL